MTPPRRPSFLSRLRRRLARGGGALLFALLVTGMAGAFLALWTRDQQALQAERAAFEAGRTAAAWFLAVHRSAQDRGLAALEGSTLTPAQVRSFDSAPRGLGEVARVATATFGVLDDGVPGGNTMAFIVVTPRHGETVPAIMSGMRAGGMAALQRAAGADGPMTRHRPAIEAALGAALADDDLYATADHGVHYDERHLYLRGQPGRPWLARMETDLVMGGNDIEDVGNLAALELETTGPAGADTLAAAGDLEGSTLTAPGGIEAGSLGAASLDAAGAVTVGALATGAVTAGSAAIAGELQSASVAGAELSAQLVAVGRALTATGNLRLQRLETGTMTRSNAPSGRLEWFNARDITAEVMSGPGLIIADQLGITGSCTGC